MAATRVMLAASFEDEELLNLSKTLKEQVLFPVLASPKIDGIRFTVVNKQAQSRSGKVLPNEHFQGIFKVADFDGLDGEVVVGQNPACTNTANGTLFNRTQSAIMTAGGMPDFSLHIFDDIRHPEWGFKARTHLADTRVRELQELGIAADFINYVEHTELYTAEQVAAFEEEALLAGYEGIMLRSPTAPYKFGRSTIKQQGLIKIKRFIDDEATVTGFEALERNTNPIVRNEFGLAKRSSHRAGKVADNLLGKLLVTHPKYGAFAIGSGFDVATRERVWHNQSQYLGRLVTFKYQPHGTMDAPRAPIFKGFRGVMDT